MRYGLFILALAGLVLCVFTTPHGVGVYPDSISYITAARNMAAGLGYVVLSPEGKLAPFAHSPPLYSAVLSGFSWFHLDPLLGARILNAFLFALNILFTGALIQRGRAGKVVACLGALLMLTSPDMLWVHTMALSEPLFIALTLVSLFFLKQTLERYSLKWLIPASLLCGLAFLTRYAGAAFLGASFLSILLFGKKQFKRRVREGFLFFILALLPSLLWMLKNYFTVGSATNRSLVFHPPTWSKFQDMLLAVDQRLFPHASLFLLVIALVLLLWNRQKVAREWKVIWHTPFAAALLLYLACYLGLLLVVVTFIDAPVPFDSRNLSPLWPLILILLFHTVPETTWFRKRRGLIFGIILMFFLILQIVHQGRWIRQSRDSGIGFVSQSWKNSPTLAYLRQMPPDVELYTNSREVVYFLTGRLAHALPALINFTTLQVNPNLSAEMIQMKSTLQGRRAFVVYFLTMPREYFPSEATLIQDFSLIPIFQSADGNVYEMCLPCRFPSPTDQTR